MSCETPFSRVQRANGKVMMSISGCWFVFPRIIRDSTGLLTENRPFQNRFILGGGAVFPVATSYPSIAAEALALLLSRVSVSSTAARRVSSLSSKGRNCQ